MDYPLSILFRVINASIGAYCLATLASIAIVPILSALFSIQLADAVYCSLLLNYFIFFVVAIISFSISSVKHLYLGMTTISALLVIIILSFGS